MIQFFQSREGTPINGLLEEFMIGFQYLFKTERSQLQKERDTLGSEKYKFAQERKQQYEELKADQKRWLENKEKVEKLYQ